MCIPCDCNYSGGILYLLSLEIYTILSLEIINPTGSFPMHSIRTFLFERIKREVENNDLASNLCK